MWASKMISLAEHNYEILRNANILTDLLFYWCEPSVDGMKQLPVYIDPSYRGQQVQQMQLIL